jgi:FdhE protein
MSRAPIRIVPQEEIAGGLKEPPAFRLPDVNSLFADRAARFDALAAQGAGEPAFLRLMAQLARAQQMALDAHAVPALPDSEHLERCRMHGLPPLGIDAPPDAAWRGALQSIVQTLRADAPAAVQHVLADLEKMGSDALNHQASRLLSLDYPALDALAVPFIGAALQVHWVKHAAALGEGEFRKLDVPTLCPVCGSPPIASVLRVNVPVPGTRYLHCVLCATEWHMSRGFCSQCEAQEKLVYYHIDTENKAASDAVKGEACKECLGYIKSLNQEKDPQLDPVADDLATLSLDILMDESGYQRASPNFFFVPGQG